MLSGMFCFNNGGGGGGGEREIPKGPDVKLGLDVSLVQLYSGDFVEEIAIVTQRGAAIITSRILFCMLCFCACPVDYASDATAAIYRLTCLLTSG